jgi:hypothetical protein
VLSITSGRSSKKLFLDSPVLRDRLLILVVVIVNVGGRLVTSVAIVVDVRSEVKSHADRDFMNLVP